MRAVVDTSVSIEFKLKVMQQVAHTGEQRRAGANC